jgi:ferredoxin
MQIARRIVQSGFLALTLFGVFVAGANCELWCPFGGVEAMYEYATQGTMLCSLGVANFYILGGVLAATLLLRRAFCGYACPIGTISEWLGRGAARLGLKPRGIPAKVDRGLALLKYLVLATILVLTWRAGELVFRGFDPCYALISRHGTDITYWAYVAAGGVAAGSLLVAMPFCRWLCPMAAVMNPVSRLGLMRIKRDSAACVDCGKCATACPMAIPVAQLGEVTHARCMACMHCVDACPAGRLGAIGWGPPPWLGGRWPQAALVGVLVLCLGGAALAARLFPLPSFVKVQGVPPANVAGVDLVLENLSCRGRANLLYFFLARDDMFGIGDYFRLEAWPGPGKAAIRVVYDPARTDAQAVRQAITEPYFDPGYGWRESPFSIEGYDALGLGADERESP